MVRSMLLRTTTPRRARAVLLYQRHRSLRAVGRKLGISHVAARKLLLGASVDISVSAGLTDAPKSLWDRRPRKTPCHAHHPSAN